MKNLATIILLFSLTGIFSSCKKMVEDMQADIVLDLLTKGDWFIEEFRMNEEDNTHLFSDYVFRFDKQGGVKYFYLNETGSGTWKENLENYSITTHFPSATSPVDMLNAEWKIITGLQDYCEAKTTGEGKTYFMKFRKK